MHIKIVVLLIALATLAAGCSAIVGNAGERPGYVKCQGKGTITGTGTLAVGGGLGGGGTNSFTLQADCGDGLIFEQGKPPEAK